MKIHFFSASFPFGKGETFVENEVPELCKHIGHLTIYPLHEHVEMREIPTNASVFKGNQHSSLSIRDYLNIGKAFWIEFRYSNNRLFFLKKWRRHGALLKKAARLSKLILTNEQVKPGDGFYSYWMNDWALALALLKMQKKIDRFVFRCGGFDIWDERNEGNYLPFRGFVYKNASAVFPNSKTAETYLKHKALFPEKIAVQYWGTADHGVGLVNEAGAIFRMVSCSNVIPLKRVHLIAEALKKVNQPVHWVHFGDGTEMENLEELVQDESLSHHEIALMGRVSNQEVYHYYRQYAVDLFISMSSTEGLPVSMQEAISFGIPLLSTDVGGVHEIVREDVGVLVEADVHVEKIAQSIKGFILKKEGYTFDHQEIRKFWINHFSAKTTYFNYAQTLVKIFQK